MSGESQGSVLDASGKVVGAIVGKLDAIRIARSTEEVPRKVTFAVEAISGRLARLVSWGHR